LKLPKFNILFLLVCCNTISFWAEEVAGLAEVAKESSARSVKKAQLRADMLLKAVQG
jgi:hypothetical protein